MYQTYNQLRDDYNTAFKDADASEEGSPASLLAGSLAVRRTDYPRSRGWLLISNSPIPVWILSCLYIGIVLVGPRIMKNRPAFKLNNVMIVYNMGLVALSLYMFVEIILSAVNAGYGTFCSVYNSDTWKDPKEARVANVLWWYFFSKAIELNDTVLMIIRKKQNQVTFLHVFHHVSMMNIWWWVMMFIPGGCAVYGSCLNCLVHVVMYSYYGLSAIPSLRQHLWWKRYITRFQLIQFVMTLSHTCYSQYLQCEFPKWGLNLLRNYMIIMIILFANFYAHAYVLKKSPTDDKRGKFAPMPRVTDNCEMSSDVREDHSKSE